MPFKDPEKRNASNRKYYEKNKERALTREAKRYNDIKQHAIDSIISGEITNQHFWDLRCNKIKQSVKKYPYSDNFTNEMIFEKMIRGCFYCGDVATTLDRIDSNINHIPDNCVGSCWGCNASKGNADPNTFMRKAFYRTFRKYFDDDTEIWSDNISKPRFCAYKSSSEKKKIPFYITIKDFNDLIRGDCSYCHRTPTQDTWNGIDRVVPEKGYVIGNVVSCCDDCNIDKLSGDVDTMMIRNKRIANRMLSGKLILESCNKVLRNRGTDINSNKVCVHGKLYPSQKVASRSIGMYDNYVTDCIFNSKFSDTIFKVTNDFYEKYKDTENITQEMYIGIVGNRTQVR